MKELEEAKSKIKDIDKEIKALYPLLREAEKEYDSTREGLLLKNDSFLQEDTWTLSINTKTFDLYLEDRNYHLKHAEGFKGLRKLYETDYHCWHKLFKKYNLTFNDGEMHISAKTNAKLLSFIKEYNLKIKHKLDDKVTNIDKQMAELQVVKDTIADLILKI